MQNMTLNHDPLISLNINGSADDYDDYESIYNVEIGSVPVWYHIMATATLTALCINGVLFNGLVLRHFWIRRNKLNQYSIVLINLAVVELIQATVGISFDVASLLQHGWKFGMPVCTASGLLVSTAGYVSIFTLCLLSFMGYGSVLRFHKNSTQDPSMHTIYKLLFITWLYAFCLSLPPLFGWGRYAPELSGVGCAPDWHSKARNESYIVWILIFGFIIPTTTIIISSVLTYCESHKTNNPRVDRKSRQRLFFKSRKINIQLIIAMNIAYLICWSPYATVAVIHCFITRNIIGPTISLIPTIAVKISVCANPLLYIAYNPNLDKTFDKTDSLEELEDEEAENYSSPSLKLLLQEVKEDPDQENKTSKSTISE